MKRIAIIGGGLAGTSCAYALKRAGFSPVIYEAGDSLASGASGNSLGLYNPRFGAEYNHQSQYYEHGFRLALETFQRLEGIEFRPLGCLHLINDERKQIRFSKMVESWCWAPEDMRIVGADEASDIAGVRLDYGALYLSQSGSVSPHKLCQAYAEGIEVRSNQVIARAADVDADIVILTSGHSLRGFEEASSIQLFPVRGQVSMVDATPVSAALKCHVNYNGYMSAADNGEHMIGSTFERHTEKTDGRDEDDAANIAKLAESIPALAQGLKVTSHRASVRCASKDHFPVVGALSDNVYISTAHGSHGLVSSLAASGILTDMILGKAPLLDQAILDALSPRRYDAG